MIDDELMKILACPACKSDVKLIRVDSAKGESEEKIACVKCGRKYPVRDGIPIMLIDEAEM